MWSIRKLKNIRITCLLWADFTVDRWFPCTKDQQSLQCHSVTISEITMQKHLLITFNIVFNIPTRISQQFKHHISSGLRFRYDAWNSNCIVEIVICIKTGTDKRFHKNIWNSESFLSLYSTTHARYQLMLVQLLIITCRNDTWRIIGRAHAWPGLKLVTHFFNAAYTCQCRTSPISLFHFEGGIRLI